MGTMPKRAQDTYLNLDFGLKEENQGLAKTTPLSSALETESAGWVTELILCTKPDMAELS